ncbi:hypothetical protein OG874_03055 [Nocardia sp. NBC_00565]|uniref:hypothetical protein n=1 Tax=Nocardia sp. NBC_00565 TaxID=2975993 RepID=UPI002E8111CB|nr:hypothetical protein [Nocardia sp. NBC_00565]WUC04204.1 hypothetical protein OG874_03055 [Nocardia sp. NBC_00565]
MHLPARFDDEDLRKLAIAPDDEEGYSYRQRDDGSWSLVDNEGWEVEFAEPNADVISAIASAMTAPIDIEPISLRDNEIR